MTTSNWKQWNPGLENDGKTLQEVYDQLPELPPEDYRFMQDLLKKPSVMIDQLALFEQDCLHIVLGRGLLAQDEAFVIGYAMGAATTLKDWEAGVFRLVAKLCHPGTYQFSDDDLKAYNLGTEQGGLSPITKLFDYDFQSKIENTLGEIREDLGVKKKDLREVYRREQGVLPGTVASQRLPV